MRLRIAAVSLLAAGLALPLVGCAGSEESGQSSTPEPQSASGSGGADEGGTAELVHSGQTQSFVLDACESTDGNSVQASGDGAGFALTIDVSDGQGIVLYAPQSDLNDTIEGTTQDLVVASDGGFTATGTFQSGDSTDGFTLTGACAG